MSYKVTGIDLTAPAAEPPPFLLSHPGLHQVQVVHGEYGPRPLWNLYVAENCVERLELAVEFARVRGILEDPPGANIRNGLINTLVYLDERVHMRTVLYPDSAPYSFYFQSWMWSRRHSLAVQRDEWLPSLSGGVIYHGRGSDGSAAPEFAVRLGSDLSEGWGVHT